ncbi:Angiomotin [Lamellibrachia satsuma]|nr:Angiomotin [Lamellibrachia satsuma]
MIQTASTFMDQDLLASRERLLLERAKQRSTIQELRAHIDVLSDALTNARSSTFKYEEEMQRCHTQEKKVDDLQKTLLKMKLITEKRELVEQRLRSKLEEEVRLLKEQKANRNRVTIEMDEGIASDSESPTSVQSLIRQVHDKEQRVLNLQAEVVKWEQKFLEESVSKQLALGAASIINRDVHVASAALECGRVNCEDTRVTVRHLQEICDADRKCAIYEAKLRSLQVQLAEKEAVIRMIGCRTSLHDTGSLTNFYSSPLHSKHPSISSLSSVTAMSPGGCSSRQSSQLDLRHRFALLHPDPRSPAHSKSNSLGSSLPSDSEGDASVTYCPIKDTQFQQCNFSAQVALRGSLPSGYDQLKECFWQV